MKGAMTSWTFSFRSLLPCLLFFRWLLLVSFSPSSFPFPLDKWSMLAGGDSNFSPFRKVCCFLTVSDCLAVVVAFSKVNLGSSCSCSESFLSFSPATILSRMRWSLKVPNSQYSARQCRSVIKVSTDSLSF